RDPNLGKVVLYQLSYFRNIELLPRITSRDPLGALREILTLFLKFSESGVARPIFFRQADLSGKDSPLNANA
ncbi:hypothetical protein, partial [uncultured Rikenella sp.]|uniref:hypothetical protein n=1 Tax=uncultured Rikenella sp. TaxID=368003 RepID=UPI0025FEE095